MADYNLKDVVYETAGFQVLRVGAGFELYRKAVAHPTKCGTFTGAGKLEEQVIRECAWRQALLDRAGMAGRGLSD